MKCMKIFALPAILLAGGICLGQTKSAEPVAIEDFKPAVSNQPGKEYPQVNSEGRVRASISAPEAMKVQLDMSGVKYDLRRDSSGVWMGD